MVFMPAKIPTHRCSQGQGDLGKHLQRLMGLRLQRKNEENLMDTINQSFNKHLFNASCVANVENSGKLQIKYIELFLSWYLELTRSFHPANEWGFAA